MKDFNITVAPQNDNLGLPFSHVTVWEGKALEQKPPEIIKINGDIKSVSSFLKIRETLGTGLQTIDKTKAVVFVNKKAKTIELKLDPENHYGASVKGTLEDADELKPWGINENTMFTKTQLVQLIKFSKLYFNDQDKHAEFLLAFQKIESTVNIKASESADDRGNKERAYIKNVTTNAPTEFVLLIPVFKGFPKYRIKVDICLEVNDGSPRFWFESVELNNLKLAALDDIFTNELEAAAGFVIINV